MAKGRKKSKTADVDNVFKVRRGSVVWAPAAKGTLWPSRVSCVYERTGKATYYYLPDTESTPNRIFSAPLKRIRILTHLDEAPAGASTEMLKALSEAKKLVTSFGESYQKALCETIVTTKSSNTNSSGTDALECLAAPTVFSSGDVAWLITDEHHKWPVLVTGIKKRNAVVQFFPLSRNENVQLVPLSACVDFDLSERKLAAQVSKIRNPERKEAMQSVLEFKFGSSSADRSRDTAGSPPLADEHALDDDKMSPRDSPEIGMNVALQAFFCDQQIRCENGETSDRSPKKDAASASTDDNSNCVSLAPRPKANSGVSPVSQSSHSVDDELSSARIVEYCTAENCRRHLLAIWQTQIVSTRHSQYKSPSVPSFHFRPQIGGLLRDWECATVVDWLDQWICKFPNAASSSLLRLDYVFAVALPEAIIHAITQILYCSGAEANRIFEERVSRPVKGEDTDAEERPNRGTSREASAPFVHLLNAASKARCDSLDSSELS